MAGVDTDEGGKECRRRGREVEDVMGKGFGFGEDFGCWVVDKGFGCRCAGRARGLRVEGYLVAGFEEFGG